MPQMALDFGGGKTNQLTASKIKESEQSKPITFWRLHNIDKDAKNVYEKVAEKLINTGSPDMDPQTALDYGPRLGMLKDCAKKW